MIFRFEPSYTIRRNEMPAYLRKGVYVAQPIKKGRWCAVQVRSNFNFFYSDGKRILGLDDLEKIDFGLGEPVDFAAVIDNENNIWIDDVQSISNICVYKHSFHFRFYKMKFFMKRIQKKSKGRVNVIDSAYVFDGVLKKMDQLDDSFSGMLLKNIDGNPVVEEKAVGQIFVTREK